MLNSFTLSRILLHRLAALTQFFVPYLRYLSFHLFATSVGHVHALLDHLSVGCVLLLLGGSSPRSSRGKARGGRWQRDRTAERSSLQKEAEPSCPRLGWAPAFGFRGSAGSPRGFVLAPLQGAFTDTQPVCQPEQRIAATPAPVQDSALLDGIEMIPFSSSF